MNDQVGAVESGGEKSFVAFEFQLNRHYAIGVRQHSVGGYDDIAVNVKRRRGRCHTPLAYSEIVCTTLETGRELTVGSLASFKTSSSYRAMVSTGAFAFICTTL